MPNTNLWENLFSLEVDCSLVLEFHDGHREAYEISYPNEDFYRLEYYDRDMILVKRILEKRDRLYEKIEGEEATKMSLGYSDHRTRDAVYNFLTSKKEQSLTRLKAGMSKDVAESIINRIKNQIASLPLISSISDEPKYLIEFSDPGLITTRNIDSNL